MFRRKFWISLVLTIPTVASAPAGGQEHPEHEPHPPEHAQEAPAPPPQHAVHGERQDGPLEWAARRTASGTAWQPESSPMHGHMLPVGAGDWHLMLHYSAFGGLDAQATPRGAREIVGMGWAMGMLQGPALGGRIGVRAMLSPDPVVQGRSGYPLLLQTGETAFGEPLVDRQHPHDLFMELALTYQRALSAGLGFELYVAPSGEPALGPVAFPHRTSAMPDPLAPLGHHWQDSTHIAFGVVTVALFTRVLKLEASAFNGVEPDEERFGIDLRVPDSASVRLTAMISDRWAISASAGRLAEPEILDPGSVVRLAASALYNQPLPNGNWAVTAVAGQNRDEGGDPTLSLLLESSVAFAGNVVFGRAEYVQKTAHDFDLQTLDDHAILPVSHFALGYVRELGSIGGIVPAVGVRGAVGMVGAELADLYGTRLPLGGAVYVWLHPAPMRHRSVGH